MKNYRILLLFLIISLNLFAQETQKVSLQLLWKHQFEFAGYYMAKEKGFYKDAGLDVKLKEYNLGTDITKDVQNGKSTFGIGYPSVILDKGNGANIVLLNAIFQSSPHVLVSLNSSNIKSIADFKNKTIMMDQDAINNATLLSMLYAHNIHKKDITIQKPSFNINDLIDGKVDLYSAYSSNELYKLDNKKIKYTIWDPKNYGFDFYNDILFTSNKLLTKNPKLVEKFQKTSLLGWKYAFNHIDETIDVILKKYNTQNKTKEALQYEAKILKDLAYENTQEIGSIKKEKIQRIIDVYNLMGLIKNKIDIDQFIYKNDKSSISLTQDEKQWIQNNKITIGISPWYPITFYDKSTNKINGVGFDLFNKVVQNLHLDVQYVPDTWNNLLTKFQKHKIDLLPTTYYTKQRATYGIFSKKYFDIKEQLYVKKSSTINGFRDLNNKTIAMVKAYGAIEKIKSKFPKIKILEVETLEKSIQMLLNDQVDAIFNTQFSVDSYIKDHFIYNLKPIYQTDFKSSPLYFFSNKEKPMLASILQKGLDNLDTETKNKILAKWINTETNNLKKLDLFTTKEKKYLNKKKSIKMCIDPDWMPFEKIQDKKHIGMTADFFKIFEHNLGYKIELVPTKNWSQSLEFAKNRKCDILSLAMETPKRKKYMNFTSPYLQVPLVLATQNDKPFVNDFTTLNNKKIGITKGYAFVELLKTKYPNLDIVEVKNLNDGLEKVTKGELYGYIGTLASVGYAFQHRFVGELKIAGKFDEKWKLGIAVRNDDLLLLNIFEKVIASVSSSQSQKIINNWLAIKYEKQVNYKYLWQILISIAIILIFFLYRQLILKKANQTLQQKVDEKTKELQELNNNLELKIEEAIKEIRQKDQILSSQAKMASMGEMIGNIAHQWRQPLSIISTVASGIKMKIEYDMFEKDEEVKHLDVLLDATEYLSSTIDDFKNFLSPEKTNIKFTIKKVIEKTIKMFGKNFASHGIEIITNTKDIQIVGHENELLQVIINIINNAKDILNTKEIDKKFIFIELSIQNDNIYLTIKDNGGGIPNDILPKIFDAYFTTKHKSVGTGLGLYMSYQIIHNSFNGTLTASNEEFVYKNTTYSGAQFTIILPLS